MATLANLKVRISGVTKDFEKSVGRVKRETKDLERDFKKLGKELAIVSTTGVAAFTFVTKKLLDVGVAAEETASKFRTVFGPEAERVSGFIEEFGVAAGFADTEARELTATVGAIAQGIGFTKRASADLSEEIVRLSADLASFNNTQGGAERVVRALISAMNGEVESLKEAANVAIVQSDVMERAAEMTGKATSEITRQERALATVALVTERAGVAVGDLARTQDSLANQQRAAGAAIRNVVEDMGEIVREALEGSDALGSVRDAVEELARAIEENRHIFQGFFSTMFSRATTVINKAADALDRYNRLLSDPDVARGRAARAELFPESGVARAEAIRRTEEYQRALEKFGDSAAGLGPVLERTDALAGTFLEGLDPFKAAEPFSLIVEGADRAADAVERTGDGVRSLAEVLRQLATEVEALPELDFSRSIEASRQRQLSTLRGVERSLSQDNLLSAFGGRRGSLGGEIRIPQVERITVDNGTVDFGAGAGGSFFDDFGGFFRQFDVTEVLSNTAANLISGGISSLIGAAVGGIRGLISGESPAEAAARRAREENNAQLQRLNQGIARLSEALLGERGADIERARQALRGSISGVSGTPFLERSDELLDELQKVGLTFADLERIVEATGIELDELGSLSVAELQRALEALNSQILNQILNNFGTQFDLLQRRFRLLDIEDPQQQIDAVLELLGEQLPAKLFARLDGALASGNLDQFIEDFFAQIDRGKFSLEQLGELSFDDFLTALEFLEGNLDSLNDAVQKTTDTFRNVPSIFKTQLRIFEASDPVTLAAGQQGAQVVQFTGPVNIGAGSTREQWEAIKREAKRDLRQGGARTFFTPFNRPGAS